MIAIVQGSSKTIPKFRRLVIEWYTINFEFQNNDSNDLQLEDGKILDLEGTQ